MSSPEPHGAILLPEILTSIAHYLDRKDFLNAILVSRSWHSNLLPLLWHTLVLPQRWRVIMTDNNALAGFPDSALVEKYGHLVRDLVCANLLYAGYLIPACSQLTQLEILDFTENTIPLISLNANTLTSVKVKREYHPAKTEESTWTQKFVQALSECQYLERLRLGDISIDDYEDLNCPRSGAVIDRRRRISTKPRVSKTTTGAEDDANRTKAIELFYETVHQLSYLTIVINVIGTPPPRPADVFYRLRRLRLISCAMSYRDQLQLVRQCQYLTHLQLHLTRTSEHLDLEELESFELEAHCPRIMHLDLCGSKIKDQEIAALLSHLPNLTELNMEGTMFAERCLDYVTGPESRLRNQLRILDVTEARSVQSHWIQKLLCSCSGLKRFRATAIKANDMVMATLDDSIGNIMVNDSHLRATASSWVCLHLQELRLSVVGIPIEDSSLRTQLQLAVYDQLSKLTDLQVLSLGGHIFSTWLRIGTLELSLPSGLGRLSSLKELRVFNFSYMAHDLGMEEVEFMMSHWIKLREVIGTIQSGVYNDEEQEAGEEGDESEGSRMEMRTRTKMRTRTRSRTMSGAGVEAGGGTKDGQRQKVERQDIYIHRRWPLVQFSSSW
ncbi:hypothetical protein BGX28_004235 [Mortierella sp. GBA30]|nr:hypothetical protein BGX28_004235 [Mortierella sp. GBA30]